MGFVDTMEKLEILVGHALIPLIFLLIIFSMKRKRKNSKTKNMDEWIFTKLRY